MKNQRKFTALLLAVAMIATLMVGCGQNQETQEGKNSSDAKPVTAKLGISYGDNHTITKELYTMADKVKERTDGGVTIEIYADSILGSDTQMYEQLYMGTLEMGLQSVSAQNTKHPELVFEDLPYLYANYDEAHKALDGEVGKVINEIIASDNVLHNLGFMELGFRQVSNNVRPINTPADFAGIKIRVNSSQLRVDTFESFDAQATIMSFGEVFTALQQDVIDGQECPLATFQSSSFNEVQKYISLTNHFYTSSALLVNDSWFDSLPTEWQTIINEEAAAAVERVREKNIAEEQELIKQLQDKGVEINEVADATPFKEMLTDVWAQYEPIVGEGLMDAYRAEIG